MRRTVSIGIDIIRIRRIRRSAEISPRFLTAVFSENERTMAAEMTATRQAEFLAGRFCAKEAALKALGYTIDKMDDLSAIEVKFDDAGSPYIVLTGSLREWSDANRSWCETVSISHDGDYATASVIVTRG